NHDASRPSCTGSEYALSPITEASKSSITGSPDPPRATSQLTNGGLSTVFSSAVEPPASLVAAGMVTAPPPPNNSSLLVPPPVVVPFASGNESVVSCPASVASVVADWSEVQPPPAIVSVNGANTHAHPILRAPGVLCEPRVLERTIKF